MSARPPASTVPSEVGIAPQAPRGLPKGRFRPELHGLRGLAIALVVVFHVAADGRVSGGIDVFLAISGFLYTASLLRRAVDGRPPGSGRFDLAGYLANLLRRLLPPALLVLGAVAMAGVWLLPPSAHPRLISELLATLWYRQNWELIGAELSYTDPGPGSSPLQHFWSLSVQGQFYLVWVVVILGAVWAARRLGRSPVKVSVVVVAALALASFTFATFAQHRHQEVAYFHTGARMWQFALAGLFALVLGLAGTRADLPRKVRLVLGWAGVGMLLSCGFLLDGAALFPGPAALWPIAALLLVLLAGATGSPFGADRMLSGRVLSWLGDVAYPLYLWHWPLLVLTIRWQGAERAGPLTGAVVIGASLVLAWLTHRGLEHPLTRSALRGMRQRAVVLVGAVLVVGLSSAVLLSWQARVEADHETELAATTELSADHLGAAVLDPEAGEVPLRDPVPAPYIATRDEPGTYGMGCVQSHQDTPEAAEVLLCQDEVPDRGSTVLIAGGSQAHMWHPTFEELAEDNDWSVHVMDKSGCHLTANVGQYGEDTDMPTHESCQDWNIGARELILDLEPDAVVTIGTTTQDDRERYSLGFRDVWADLAGYDIPVIAIRDVPRAPSHVPQCLEGYGDAQTCGRARDVVLDSSYPVAEDPELPATVVPLDLTDYLCTEDWCPAIVGNVVVYRDYNHLTATYARTLAPYVDAELRQHAPWLYG